MTTIQIDFEYKSIKCLLFLFILIFVHMCKICGLYKRNVFVGSRGGGKLGRFETITRSNAAGETAPHHQWQETQSELISWTMQISFILFDQNCGDYQHLEEKVLKYVKGSSLIF